MRVDQNQIVVQLEKGEGTLQIEKVGTIKKEQVVEESISVDISFLKTEPEDAGNVTGNSEKLQFSENGAESGTEKTKKLENGENIECEVHSEQKPEIKNEDTVNKDVELHDNLENIDVVSKSVLLYYTDLDASYIYFFLLQRTAPKIKHFNSPIIIIIYYNISIKVQY